MLAQGRQKGLPAHWIQADARYTPLTPAIADCVFSVYMLHHLQSLEPLFYECARLLRDGGCTAHVTTTHAFIHRHPVGRYFPSFASIDKARFQSLDTIVAAMRSAGLARIDSQVCRAGPVPIDHAYLDRVANQFISTFALLPQDEFAAGLARLRADIEATGQLAEPMRWESLVVWGYRGTLRT
jgi:SAM-dependent methyltransferase